MKNIKFIHICQILIFLWGHLVLFSRWVYKPVHTHTHTYGAECEGKKTDLDIDTKKQQVGYITGIQVICYKKLFVTCNIPCFKHQSSTSKDVMWEWDVGIVIVEEGKGKQKGRCSISFT